MVATVVVSGAFGVSDKNGIDGFVTANLGGAAGDVVAVWKDADPTGGVYVLVSKA